MTKLRVAGIQCALGGSRAENVDRIEHFVLRAAKEGAQVILPPELFEGPYFCQTEENRFFEWARPAEGNPTIEKFQKIAKAHNVVIPISFFERAGQTYYNTVAIIDADGTNLGIYRKSHIPDGPGYEEKFYFRGGDTGFRAWQTKHGVVGVGICWDQWFPECARAMTLLGAEVLFYPTAIGSEPANETLDTKDPWQRVMIGHAVANAIPVVAANRIGTEGAATFYGSSFISNHRGDFLSQLGRTEEGLVSAEIDLEMLRENRAGWGFFRDRRPELYGPLTK